MVIVNELFDGKSGLLSNKYGNIDADSMIFLKNFNELINSHILAVGNNEEFTGHILTDNGYQVTGVDLRPFFAEPKPNYVRIEGDFVGLAKYLPRRVNSVYSLSALEHFGLGTYGEYDINRDSDYDSKAVDAIYDLLCPGGSFYVTVPFGANFYVSDNDWRVYNRESLRSRIIRKFNVEKKIYFKSADCDYISDVGGIVVEEDAERFRPGNNPDITVFLKMRKAL